MLEKIGTPGHRTISRPDDDFIDAVKSVISSGNPEPMVAEIGVGIGATTVHVAKALDNAGELHLFDFEDSVRDLTVDLEALGFTNVRGFGNTTKHWDSYHWSLARLISVGPQNQTYDVIYIDGAHTYLHDALAFFLCDRLVKVGGTILFDDYLWRFADSNYLRKERLDYMTQEQVDAHQIKMFIDDLVVTHRGYETVIPSKSFRKLHNTTGV